MYILNRNKSDFLPSTDSLSFFKIRINFKYRRVDFIFHFEVFNGIFSVVRGWDFPGSDQSTSFQAFGGIGGMSAVSKISPRDPHVVISKN